MVVRIWVGNSREDIFRMEASRVRLGGVGQSSGLNARLTVLTSHYPRWLGSLCKELFHVLYGVADEDEKQKLILHELGRSHHHHHHAISCNPISDVGSAHPAVTICYFPFSGLP